MSRKRRHRSHTVSERPSFEPPEGGPAHEPIDEVIDRWWPGEDLSDRARCVVLLRATGWGPRAIADELGICRQEARWHWSRARMALFARVRDLLEPGPVRAAFDLLAQGEPVEIAAHAAGLVEPNVERAMARALVAIMRETEPLDAAVRRLWEESTRQGSGGRDLH